MEPGRLRHSVLFESLQTTVDSDGATVEDWVPAFDGRFIPADVAPLSGKELIAAGSIQAEVNTRIIIRYRPGVLPSMRVVYGTTLYNILAVIHDPNSGREWITLMCSSGVKDG
jgi:SPP1 family predicted phage head-tail adaptor